MSSPSFESLRVWHEARQLVVDIYDLTRSETFCRDYALCDQLRRAAISVMSNIAEGHERRGYREFMHFLRVAKASCGEVRSHLYVAEDVGYVDAKVAAHLRGRAAVLSRKVGALSESLRSTQTGKNAWPAGDK